MGKWHNIKELLELAQQIGHDEPLINLYEGDAIKGLADCDFAK